MKTVIACALALACGVLAARPHEDVVKPGVNIDHVATTMTDAGFKETMLALAPGDEAHGLKMWSVGEGILICTFAKKDKTVTAISYFFCDERPKSTRKEFDFPVKKFHPQTRDMQILAPKKPDES